MNLETRIRSIGARTRENDAKKQKKGARVSVMEPAIISFSLLNIISKGKSLRTVVTGGVIVHMNLGHANSDGLWTHE